MSASAYLNHAGTSWPKPPSVRAAAARAYELSPEASLAEIDVQFRAVAEALGLAPEATLLTPGCTSALALAIESLPWGSGETVVVAGLIHAALERPVAALRARGVKCIEVPPRIGPGHFEPLDLHALAEALRAPSVRAVCLPAACNVTGALMPLEAAHPMIEAAGAVLIVDAAQTVGWLPLPTGPRTMVAFGSHKGLLGPWGMGGLSWGSEVSGVRPRMAGNEPARPSYCDGGSVDRAALAGVRAGLECLRGDPSRRPRALRFVQRLQYVLLSSDRAELVGPEDPGQRVPIMSFRSLAGRSHLEIGRALSEAGVVVSTGLQCASRAHAHLGTEAEGGVVRLSVGALTSESDVGRAEDGLASVLSMPNSASTD